MFRRYFVFILMLLICIGLFAVVINGNHPKEPPETSDFAVGLSADLQEAVVHQTIELQAVLENTTEDRVFIQYESELFCISIERPSGKQEEPCAKSGEKKTIELAGGESASERLQTNVSYPGKYIFQAKARFSIDDQIYELQSEAIEINVLTE